LVTAEHDVVRKGIEHQGQQRDAGHQAHSPPLLYHGQQAATAEQGGQGGIRQQQGRRGGVPPLRQPDQPHQHEGRRDHQQPAILGDIASLEGHDDGAPCTLAALGLAQRHLSLPCPDESEDEGIFAGVPVSCLIHWAKTRPFSSAGVSGRPKLPNRAEAPGLGEGQPKAAVHAVTSHHAPQRFGGKHHPAPIQAAGLYLGHLPGVVRQAGVMGELNHHVDTGHGAAGLSLTGYSLILYHYLSSPPARFREFIMFASTVIGPAPLPSPQVLAGASRHAHEHGPRSEAPQAARPDATQPHSDARDTTADSRTRVTPGDQASRPDGETLTETQLRQLERMKDTDR
jgi:hypothetical protein